MNIICLLARVPDTAARITVRSDGQGIETAGVAFVANPYDEFALEEALRLREKAGTGTVTVITVGPPEATKELRECLARGADNAIHVKMDTSALDSSAIASILAETIRPLSFDLILAGKQATDGDSAAVPVMLAGRLGLPAATRCIAVAVAVDGGRATIRHEYEGGVEVIALPLPAVLTAEKGLNEPRYASLKNIMAAKKKEIREVAPPGVAPATRVRTLEPPPARPAGRIVGTGRDAVRDLVALLRGEAKVI